METSFHPRRGRERIKTKQGIRKEETPESFDWDEESSKEEHSVKSIHIFFLVPTIIFRTSPGSGEGLIPPHLPRREKRAKQELTQNKALQRGVFASRNLSLALSIYVVRISSDYRLFINSSLFLHKCKKN